MSSPKGTLEGVVLLKNATEPPNPPSRETGRSLRDRNLGGGTGV